MKKKPPKEKTEPLHFSTFPSELLKKAEESGKTEERTAQKEIINILKKHYAKK